MIDVDTSLEGVDLQGCTLFDQASLRLNCVFRRRMRAPVKRLESQKARSD